MGKNLFEATQDLLTDLENAFNSAERLETTEDNLYPTLDFAGSYLFGFHMHVDVVWLTGALVLGIIYAGVHFTFDRRHRDSWDAYLTRERDRLDRIGRLLDAINLQEIQENSNSDKTQKRLQQLKALLEHYEADTKALLEYLGDEYALELGFTNTGATEGSTETDTESTEDLNQNSSLLPKKTKKKIEFILLLTDEQQKKYQALMSLISDGTTSNQILLASDKGTTVNASKEEKLKALQAKLTTIDMNLINGPGFNAALAYALAYWLVIYFTTLAVPVAGLATPLTWALSALLFPAIYLIYKEFVSYKTRVLEKPIDTIKDDEERANEQDKRNDQLNFRLVWIFIALIAGVSLGFILPTLGFSLAASIGIGAATFIGTVGLSVVAGALIDRRVEQAREENAQDISKNAIYDRKKWAALRRNSLDEIALIAYELELQSKLSEQRKSAGLAEITPKVYVSAIPVSTLLPNTQDDQPVTHKKEDDSPQPKRKTSFAEKIRLVLNIVLGFLAGYALGNMLGFVFGDLLSHFSTAFLPGPFVWAATAILSSILGGLFVKRAYYTEKIHQAKLDILFANGNLAEKQNTLSALEKEISETKVTLKKLATEKKGLILNLGLTKKDITKPLKGLQPDLDFVHPVQQEGISKRKILFGLRSVFQVLTSIGTALFFTRMLLLFGFAKFIPALSGGSLIILGASVGPLGFVVLGLALCVLLMKAANDIYLSAQREKEATAMERVDFDIACKQAERDYLVDQTELMQQAKNKLESLSNENHDSNQVLLQANTGLHVSTEISEEPDPTPKDNYN